MRRHSFDGLPAGVLICAMGAACHATAGFTDAADASAVPAPFMSVSGEQGMVTLHTRAVPLDRLLAELGRRFEFELVIHGRLDESTAVDISDLPLTDALHRLLARHSTILRSEAAGVDNDSGERSRLRRVDIFVSAGPGRSESAPAAELPSGGGGAAAAPAGLVHLDDPDPEVRRAALQQAYGLAPEQAAPLLGSVLRIHPDPAVRAGAIDVLARIGAEGAFDALAGSLGDEDPDLRLTGARALLGLDGHRAVPNLGQLLYGDRDRGVRRAAARLLAALEHQAARALLADFEEDEDEVIRGLALGGDPGPLQGDWRR